MGVEAGTVFPSPSFGIFRGGTGKNWEKLGKLGKYRLKSNFNYSLDLTILGIFPIW